MSWLYLAIIVFVSTVLVFHRAEECYFCWSRSVVKRSKFNTRGICQRCIEEGEEL